MSPHKQTAICDDCPSHSRIEQRIDWLYNNLLPWLGVLSLVQLLGLAVLGAWLNNSFKDMYNRQYTSHQPNVSMISPSPGMTGGYRRPVHALVRNLVLTSPQTVRRSNEY